MSTIGHNSKAFDQTLAELSDIVEDTNSKLPKRRFPYFKFYPRDWLEATRNLTLEERGAYIDYICMFMESEGNLADDDDWIRHQMHVPKQRWKKVKTALVAHGKISIENGRIVNQRCLRELDDLMQKSRQNSENIKKRWRKVGEKLEESSNKVQTFFQEKSEKDNKINAHANTNVIPRALASDSDSDKDNKPPLDPPWQGDKRKKVKSKARLPDDWTIDFDWRSKTKGKFGLTDMQIDKEAERFKRYWTSPDAKNPRKADWWRTWENWIDRALERGISTKPLNGNRYSYSGHYTGELL